MTASKCQWTGHEQTVRFWRAHFWTLASAIMGWGSYSCAIRRLVEDDEQVFDVDVLEHRDLRHARTREPFSYSRCSHVLASRGSECAPEFIVIGRHGLPT